MERLLDINITHASIRFKVNNAQIKYKSTNPTSNINVQKGGFEMNKTPDKLNIDMHEVKNDLGIKQVRQLISDYSETARITVDKAVRDTVQNGNQLALPSGMSISDIAKSDMVKQYDTNIKFIPKEPAKVSYIPEKLNLSYTPDKVAINWNVKTMIDLDYIRPSFELDILTKPAIDVEYLGEPIYIPRDYEPGKTGADNE